VFPKLFDRVWHDFTTADAWEVFPETVPVFKVLHRTHTLLSNAIAFLDELMPLTRAQTLRDNGIKVALVSNFDERLVLLSPSIHMCYG
jgi:hypothetical protein